MADSLLLNKVLGCFYGGALGDAIGAPAEGRTPHEIRRRYDWITGFVEPWDGPSDLGKGDGRYTDDTHMVQILGKIYVEAGDHLDVFRFAREIVPPIADNLRWVPEFGRDMLLVDRLFYPEKWLLMRLRLANADPRVGGIGNMVNCGSAMFASPVGIVNAADPVGAYREAVEIFSAHQTSYGLEAAGVMAACIAHAFVPTATVDSVIETALEFANEGTKSAIAAVTECARGYSDRREAIGPLRDAMRPFDGGAEGFLDRGNGTNDWQPSRLHSIEELPIALGFLVVTGGDFEQSMFGGANYGRDCDSIASMAGAIAGTLHGAQVIRPEWIDQIDRANRCNLRPLASDLSALAVALQQKQQKSAVQRANVFAELTKSSLPGRFDSMQGR